MKLPVSWLRELVHTPLSDDELAERLTMAGLEVEETTASDDGPVFHTKVTPNRGDWLSVVGVAREAAATLDVPLQWHPQPLPDENDDITRWAGVRIVDATLCPRYAGKLIRNIELGPSPDWMQRRLMAAGMRPINVVVDVTNYVMLELGQPLHAFDYDKLPEGKVVVRPTQAGETIQTLDGVNRELDEAILAICDRDRPIAIAGVMGGANSEVSADTRHIFLESAHFDPGSIRRTAKKLGLSTEASYRFERFVDPELAPVALERACDLLAELAGGEVVLGRIDLYPQALCPVEIALRPARANAILGTTLSEQTIAHSLRRLGLAVEAAGESLQVSVPTFRPDVAKEIDLIEEVGRMVGYDTLPETLPPARGGGGGDVPPGRFAARLRAGLMGLGLQEVLTHTLAAPSPFDDPNEANQRVQIRQALSAELSGLRQNLLPNLLDVLARNLRQRQADVRIFEVGKVFAKGIGDGAYTETRHVAGVLTGASDPRAWDAPNPPPVDFFAAKGLVEALAARLNLPPLTFQANVRLKMHPGRCAAVSVGDQSLGYVAEVDPDALKTDLDVPAGAGRVAVFELDADALLALSSDARRYVPLPRFPVVSRDLAVVVSADTPYALLKDAARDATDPALHESIALQSLYTGEGIPQGKKSVALRLTFRSADRTLTDAEVDAQMSAVQAALAQQVGAERR